MEQSTWCHRVLCIRARAPVNCIAVRFDAGGLAEGEQYRTLRARFQALTGQQEVPLGLQSASEITLKH